MWRWHWALHIWLAIISNINNMPICCLCLLYQLECFSYLLSLGLNFGIIVSALSDLKLTMSTTRTNVPHIYIYFQWQQDPNFTLRFLVFQIKEVGPYGLMKNLIFSNILIKNHNLKNVLNVVFRTIQNKLQEKFENYPWGPNFTPFRSMIARFPHIWGIAFLHRVQWWIWHFWKKKC